jgi:hypothetical protein
LHQNNQTTPNVAQTFTKYRAVRSGKRQQQCTVRGNGSPSEQALNEEQGRNEYSQNKRQRPTIIHRL